MTKEGAGDASGVDCAELDATRKKPKAEINNAALVISMVISMVISIVNIRAVWATPLCAVGPCRNPYGE